MECTLVLEEFRVKRCLKWILFSCLMLIFSAFNCQASQSTKLKEVDYLDKYEVIYQNMMDKVKYIEKTGDFNVDFLLYMLPYEQFGVELTRSELRYGSNQVVKSTIEELVKENKEHIKSIEKLLKTMEKNIVIDEVKEEAFLTQYNQIYEEMLVNLQGNPERKLDSVDNDYLEKILIYLDYEQKFSNLILANSNDQDIIKLCQKMISQQEKEYSIITELIESRK